MLTIVIFIFSLTLAVPSIFCPRIIWPEKSLPRHGYMQRKRAALIPLFKHGPLLPLNELGQKQNSMGKIIRKPNFLNPPLTHDTKHMMQNLERFLRIIISHHGPHRRRIQHHTQLLPQITQILPPPTIRILHNILLHPHHIRIIPPKQNLLQRTIIIVPLGILRIRPPLQNASRVLLEENAHDVIREGGVVERSEYLGAVHEVLGLAQVGG
mmetsp:Transcript_28753/g.61319  ORF Transcript_28753/g.61319 Transcript_28753/m.61319 type:complete len:211 (-) Transcript_28753:922-1554(-)